MKKIISVLLCISLILVCSACDSKQQNAFKKEAMGVFEKYSDVRQGGKRKTTFAYSENGSYAVERVITGSPADDDIKKYCDSVVNEFEKSKKQGDKLFVTYRLYAANKNVGSVEVISVRHSGNNKTEDVKIFNYDKVSQDPVSGDLKTAVSAHAVREGKTVADDAVYMFKKDGLHAGDYVIDYNTVYHTLPSGLKETLTPKGHVVDLSKKLVAITYDDGPCELTDDILDIYEEHGQVATFFEQGYLIKTQPEAIKRMDAMGCEIGSHTWSHKYLTKISVSEIKSQVNKTDAALESILGKKTTLLRPPYGAVNKTARNNVGKPLIGWSLDTLDWQSRNADKVVNCVKNAGDLDGQVVLMHSLYESSVEATRELVPWLIENGYQLVTVSELFEYKYNQTPEVGKFYTSTFFQN